MGEKNIGFEKYFITIEDFKNKFNEDYIECFLIGGWSLHLKEHGRSFLAISLKNQTLVSRLIKYSVSILNSKAEETNTFYFDLKLAPNHDWGLFCVITRKELLENAEELLPGGSLKLVLKVVTCVNSENELPATEIYQDFADPFDFIFLEKVEEDSPTFHLNMKNFPSEIDYDQVLKSDVYTHGSGDQASKWYLTFHPRGFHEVDFASVYLHVILPSAINEIEIKARISFINNGVHRFGRMFRHKFNEQSKKLEFVHFCHMSDFLIDSRFQFSIETLMLDCKIELLNESPSKGLINDYKYLLDSKAFADVTIKIGEQTMLVHKVVLIARSPVFFSMFSTEMSEKKENVVTISDIEFPVMQELIHYIYTDQVQNLKEFAAPLLVAADKYNLKSLVAECKKFLLSNLTNENFFDATKIADQLNINDLMIVCKKFFKKNYKMLVEMPDWILFVTEQPRLMTDFVREI